MTTDPPRWMEYLPLDELVEAERNPKRHSPDIAASLTRFGYVEAIALDERTGRMVAGHGRRDDLLAKQAAGEDPPEGIVVADDGRWLAPVQRGWSSRDDDHAEGYIVASNQLPIAGGWDLTDLAGMLDAMPDLIGTGFTPAAVDAMLSALTDGSAPIDPAAEWVGMPEFDQPSRRPALSLLVHFATDEDAQRFSAEVLARSQPLKLDGSGPTRSVWWPHADGLIGSDQTHEFVAEEG